MKRIEIRTMIAYLMIAAMVFAAIAGIAYLRHNSPRRRYHRDRLRTSRRRDHRSQLRTAKIAEAQNARLHEFSDDAPLADPLHAENLR